MKLEKYLFLVFLILLSCPFISAQARYSIVKIKFEDEEPVVSGTLTDVRTKKEITEKIKIRFGNEIDFSRIQIVPTVMPFGLGWQERFDAAFAKLKNWKSGVFIFSANYVGETSLPKLSDEILNAEIVLSDNEERVKISDFGDKTVVLFLLETCCPKCIEQANFLRDLKTAEMKNVEIIGVSFQTSADERKEFRRLHETLNYKIGWAEPKLQKAVYEMTKFSDVPQVLVTRSGKLYGVYGGTGRMVNQSMRDMILEVSNEK